MRRQRDKVVVIGAGVGGLSAALRLAHDGCDVTVLERHGHPGGKMRTLPSVAGRVDTGPTVMTLRHVFEALFDSVGETLSDHVRLVPETVLARHWWADGSTLDLHADPARSAAAVRAFAGPTAEAEFQAFSASAARLFTAFDAPMMQHPRPRLAALAGRVLRDPGLIPAMAPGRTLAQSLAARFSDPRLRQLFGRYATYVGGSPYQSPALLSLIWQAEAGGVWRVQGGMHRLAEALAALAERQGARFRFDSHVDQIETSGGRVTGVRLRDGTRIAADTVLFNGDPRALTLGLLGNAARRAVPDRAVSTRSLSAWVWAFAATPVGRDLHHHNVFFGRDPQSEFDDLAAGRMPRDPTLYICAQDRGTGTRPKGPERFEIIMNAPPLTGRQNSPEREEICTCRTRVFETLAGWGLTFDKRPQSPELTTPARFEALFPGSAGSLYGLSPHGMTAALRKPRARSAVRGLYLAGGGTHPGAGIPMAALSGRHAAEAILTDLASTSRSPRTDTPGGMSTGSAHAARAPSRSSAL